MKIATGQISVILSAALLSCLPGESSETLAMANSSDLSMEADRLLDISVETIHGDVAGKSPAFLPEEDYGFFVTGDFLYRKAKLTNLDFAVQVEQTYSDVPLADTSTATMHENIYEPHFRWGYGFRVDAGYVFTSLDAWEIDLIWTYSYNKANQSLSAPFFTGMQAGTPSTVILPSWQTLNKIFEFLTHARSQWRLHFNTFDFELARNFFSSKYLSIRPLISVRGAWIKQHYLVEYLYGASAIRMDPMNMNAKTNYWGVGPRLGVDLFWHITKHFGVYGNASGSLLYGRFDVTQDFSINHGKPQTILPQLTQSIHRRPWRARSNLESGVGLAWESSIDRKEHPCHLTLGVGYEIAYWFDMNLLMRNQTSNVLAFTGFNENEEGGNLGIQGWNFHVRLDY